MWLLLQHGAQVYTDDDDRANIIRDYHDTFARLCRSKLRMDDSYEDDEPYDGYNLNRLEHGFLPQREIGPFIPYYHRDYFFEDMG